MSVAHAIFAQIDPEAPSATGLPGASLLKQALGWLRYLALFGSVASLLLGAALWGVGQLSGNAQGAQRGRQLLIGGLVGAIIAGAAFGLVNLLYTQGDAVK